MAQDLRGAFWQDGKEPCQLRLEHTLFQQEQYVYMSNIVVHISKAKKNFCELDCKSIENSVYAFHSVSGPIP